MSERHPGMRPREPVFVERQTYRRRRLMDGARLLPVLALMLWCVPLLWRNTAEAGIASSGALIYIFGVWLGLVVAACLLSVRLRLGEDDTPPGDGR